MKTNWCFQSALWFFEFFGFKYEKRRPPPNVIENEEDLTEEEKAKWEEDRKNEEERRGTQGKEGKRESKEIRKM